jgi:hypothetical protein
LLTALFLSKKHNTFSDIISHTDTVAMKENALAALAFLRALITATWSSAQRAGALVGVVGGVEGLQHSHDEVGNRCQPYRYPQDGDVAILWVDGWDVEGMEGCRVDNAALPLPLPLPLPCLPAFPTSAVVQQTCKRPATQVPQLKTVVNASNQSSPRGRNRWHLILVGRFYRVVATKMDFGGGLFPRGRVGGTGDGQMW